MLTDISLPSLFVLYFTIYIYYRYDRVITFEGEPGVECNALTPVGLETGFNRFLTQLRVTLRRDPTNFRPRINKKNSALDRKQKAADQYFLLTEDEWDMLRVVLHFLKITKNMMWKKNINPFTVHLLESLLSSSDTDNTPLTRPDDIQRSFWQCHNHRSLF